jgi:excisionase family DNA binding protein
MAPSTPLTTGQVAEMFGVTAETVASWADTEKLPSFRTPGGHRRFRPADVDALLSALTSPGTEATA